MLDLRIAAAIFSGAVPTIAAAMIVASPASAVAPASYCTTSAAASADEILSPEQTRARVAANITAARGKPTEAGRTLLRSRPESPVAGLVASLSDDSYEVESTIVATDAQPPTEAPGTSMSYRLQAANAIAAPTKRARAAGATITYFTCGPGFQANLIWYCRPGSSCTTRWYFWARGPLSRTSYCSIVNRYSCQVYATADPPYFDSVMYATMTQSMPGAPVIGDKWCSW